MNDLRAPQTIIGYCTNVHAGAGYKQMLANLDQYALAVKRKVSPDQAMGVGLWLSAQAARALVHGGKIPELADWLGERGLLAYTINGFPHGDFHQESVKHLVYEPNWADPERYRYTMDLVSVLVGLLPPGGEGSISTLPLGWRSAMLMGSDALSSATTHLLNLVHQLARVELDTGKLIHIDLEPEPGCYLDQSQDVVRFYQQHLLRNADELSVREYIRICHDVCHAAVMFEDQTQVLRRYRDAGLKVGKVQVSSALHVPLDRLSPPDRHEALEQLRGFAEDRYLHQTVVRHTSGRPQTTFYEDLPHALMAERTHGASADPWRVHFHVPIFLDRLGLLETTQADVRQAIKAAMADPGIRHYEVETYAWGVLPAPHQRADLAEGIADELLWLQNVAREETQ